MTETSQTTPELRLWLAHAARNGAIHEADGPEAHVVLLPSALQTALGLPEQVTVTASPDAAREEGLLLLCAGHPLVDAVAQSVLESGDAGERWLAWPARPLPPTAELLEHARSFLPVDHGRVDLAAEPSALFTPLLRVGTLVTYTVDERFQEREEVWVDGRSGVIVGRVDPMLVVSRRMSAHPVAVPDLARALSGAEAALGARIDRRLRELSAAALPAVREETARAAAYYHDVLVTLTRRRDAAAADRQPLFDARIAATEQERDRRLQEIGHKFGAEHCSRPFRMHIVHCPAMELPLLVRRGERTWPVTLTRLLHDEAFVPPRCPACGAAETLVAGRMQLGCRRCLPRTVSPRAVSIEVPGRRVARPQATPPTTIPVEGEPKRGTSLPATARATQTGAPKRTREGREKLQRTHGDPRTTAHVRAIGRELEEMRAHLARQAARLQKAGDRLALDLWQATASCRPLPQRHVLEGSPFATAQRLFGVVAPLVVTGIPVATRVDSCTSATDLGDLPLQSSETFGYVRAGRVEHPYLLRWHWVNKEAKVSDLVSPLTELGSGFLDADSSPSVQRSLLFWNAPRPVVRLDAVEQQLWDVDAARAGVSQVIRCIAVWAALRAHLDHLPPALAAASLAAVIGRRRGSPRTTAQVCHAYNVDAPMVREVTRRLQRVLGPYRH